MNRLLLCLALCLALVLPSAAAHATETPPPGEGACTATWDDDCPDVDLGEDEPGDGELADGQGDEPDPCATDDGAGDDGQTDDGAADPGEDEGWGGWDEPEGEASVGEPELENDAAPGFRDFCEAPVFDPGFLRRKLRVTGAPTAFAGGVLTVGDASIARLPQRFREQAARLDGLELAVVVGRRTKLSRSRQARGAKRRGEKGVSQGALRRARRVTVEGKLLPPSRWRRDADGLRVPTISAKRVTVLR